jgi:apolipoprotein N-acyltransferase
VTSTLRVVLERVALVGLGVLLDTLSMPPGPAPVLVFAADVPFLLLLYHRAARPLGPDDRPREGVHRAGPWWLWAYLFGFARVAVGLRWLSAIHALFPLGPGLFLGLVYVAWGGAIRLGVRRGAPWLLLVPTTAVLEEMARTVFLGGMPWPARSLALTAWQPLLGFAAVFGAYGLSFLAALGSAWLSGLPSLLRGREVRAAVFGPWLVRGILVAATVAVAAYRGGIRVAAVDYGVTSGETAVTGPVIAIQGSVPQSLKHSDEPDARQRILDRHVRLSTEALAAHPAAVLVVWPETMIPYPFLSPELAERFPEFFESETNVVRHLAAATPPGSSPKWAVGAPYYLEGERGPKERLEDHETMDSVFFVDPRRVPDGPVVPHPEIPGWRPPWEVSPGRHDKVILVPGGEYTPMGEVFPPLRAFKDYLSPIPELTAGSRETSPFLVEILPPEPRARDRSNREVYAGTANCFEIAFPAFCRSWRRRGATVLLNVANYGWFGDSDMPAQALAIARLRAAELGMSVVVAGNTGPTAVVDPAGRVRAQVEVGGRTQFVEGWCASPVWSDTAPGRVTGYTVSGDVPWYVLAGLLLLWCAWPRRRPDASAPAGPPASEAASEARPGPGPGLAEPRGDAGPGA